MPIYFFKATDPYGCFSNFSRHGFELGDRFWATAEHYFQSQKFVGTEYVEQVACAWSPREAAERGRSREVQLRADWEAVKEDVMRAAVRRKFETHADIRAVLLGTGDEVLVENAPDDFYWGCGTNGSGRNMLGLILMEVRAALCGQNAESGAEADVGGMSAFPGS